MANSPISANDLTLLRSDQYVSDIALHIVPLQTVQTGTILTVPVVSPFVEFTWDGAPGNIEVGQMVKIVNGDTLKTWAVIRKLPSGAALFISTTPLGSAGTSTQIENTIQVGDTVTVYTHRPMWGMYSRIASSIFYKSWDIPYTDQNENVPPVSNSGTWQVAKLASGVSTQPFTLPKEGANTSFAFGGFTISSYLWTLPSGVTLASGFNLTDDVIDVDAVAGRHLVSLTVTDSNANTHTSHLWLFVSDGTTGTSLSERYVIDDMSGSSTRQGTEITFTITGENLKDVFYPSAAIVLKQWIKYDSSDLSDGVLIDTFVGYITHDGLNITHDGDIGTATITFASPVLIAKSIVQPSQSLEDVTSPSHWAECNVNLSNPRGHLFYVIQWHTPNLLSMHDFDAPFATPRKKFGTFNTNNLGAAMKVTSDYIAGNLGSTADGKTIMRENPLYMSNTDRNAVANIITWQEQDIDPQRGFSYIKRMGAQLAESFTGAFSYDGTARKAWAAAKFWGQGKNKATLVNFIVTVAQGITRIKEVIGHYHAEQNSDTRTIHLNLNGLQDVIDPSSMLWVSLNVSSDFDPHGDGFANKRMLPISVDRAWSIDDNGVALELTLNVQPETFGQAGEEVLIGSASTHLSGGWSVAEDVPFSPSQDRGTFGTLLTLHDVNGKFAYTPDRFTATVEYTDLSASVDNETVNDWDVDWNSLYFNGNDPTQAIGVYAVTTTGTTLNVWYFADILNSTFATIIQTYTMNDSSCTSEARLECSETTPTYCAVAWHDQTGTEFGYSSDGGATWQAKANVGSTVSDTANDNAPLAMDIDGTVTIISAPDSTPEYGMYKASTVGGAFTEITNTERTSAPQPMAKIEPDGTKGYISTIDTVGGTGIQTVTFDSGGAAYTASTTGTASVTTGGNGGNCYRATSLAPSEYIQVTFDAGVASSLVNLSFEYYFSDANVNSIQIQLVVDGSLVGLAYDLFVEDAWTFEGMFTVDDFPAAGQVFGVRLTADSAPFTMTDVRIDNMIVTQGTFTEHDVTFDAGGGAYSVATNGTAAIAAVGNPDNAYQATALAANTGYIEVEVDLGASYPLAHIEFDHKEIGGGNNPSVQLYVDGSTHGISHTLPTISVWRSFKNLTDVLPATGQIIKIRVTAGSGSPPTDLRIDNFVVSYEVTGTSMQLFGVDPITGAAVWTDITPATDESPERPHDLSIGLIDNQVIDVVSGTSKNWYTSLNSGTSFNTSESSSDKRTFLTAGETVLEGGDGEVKISYDSGTTFEDITGNLASVWGGTIGIIKRIFAL